MLKIRQKAPTSRHWEVVNSLKFQTINLDLFCAHWDVNHVELAQLTGAPYNTVRKWFCPSARQHPSDMHLLRLAIIHKKWLEVDNAE